MDYTSTDGFVNLVPIEHPNRQVHPQKKKKSDLDDEQTSRKTQTVKIGSKSSLRLWPRVWEANPSTVSCRAIPQLLDAYWQKKISVKLLVSLYYGCRQHTVLLQKLCCCRKSSDTVTGLHTEKAENTKTTSNFHPPTPLLISKLKSHSEPNFTESLDNVGFSFLPLQYKSLIECLLPISTTIPSVQFSSVQSLSCVQLFHYHAKTMGHSSKTPVS